MADAVAVTIAPHGMRLRNGTLLERLATGTRVTLPGGDIVLGSPHDTDAYRATARELGYGDDTLAMCQQHDMTHGWLCSLLGLPDSPSLRVAAGLDAPNALADSEEAAVLAVQRFCQLAGVSWIATGAF